MAKIDEIYEKIRDMDYVTVTPQHTPVPNFYKLGDGTILGVITHLNHLITNPTDPNRVSTNFSSETFAFVPSGKRKPEGKQLDESTSATVIDEDMKYTTLKEDFNVYDLSSGGVISIKTVLGQVQKTDRYNNVGEPIYNVNAQPIIKVKRGNRLAKRTG